MSRLSPHFNSNEFKCKGNHACQLVPPPCDLLIVLELLRSAGGGKPLPILSGYRCPAHNAQVGGATASRHMKGDAVDLPAGRFRVDQAVAAGAVGIGTKDGWVVHVDVRPGPVTRWTY